MSSAQAQLSAELRALRAGIGDGRSATWAADQALKGLRGAMHQAGRSSAPLGGADALLAGAMRSLHEAEQRRQGAQRAVDRWLALHGASGGGGSAGGGTSGGGGGGSGQGGRGGLLDRIFGAPTLGDGAPGYEPGLSAEAKRLAVTIIAPFGTEAAMRMIGVAAETIVPGFTPATQALEKIAVELAKAIAAEGLTNVLEHAGERLLRVPPERGPWFEQNDWRRWAVVFVLGAFASGLMAGTPLWAAGSVSAAFNVAGWRFPKKT